MKLLLPAAVLLWAGVIFWLSSIPHLRSGLPQDMILRKIAHVTEYFILAALIHLALIAFFRWKKSRVFLAVTVFCFLFASSDEAHQLFVDGRYGSFRDILIDSLGILGFVVCFGSIRLRKTVAACALCLILACPSTAISHENCAPGKPETASSEAATVQPLDPSAALPVPE